jgi:hypothetical protein
LTLRSVEKSSPEEITALRDSNTQFFALRKSAEAGAVVDIGLKAGATALDELEGFFYGSTALRLVASDCSFFREADTDEIDAVLEEAEEESAKNFPSFCKALEAEGWNTSRLLLGTGNWRYKGTSA